MVRVEQQEQELKKGRGPRVEVIDKQRRYTVENPRERERERIPVKGGEKRRPECKLELELDSGEIDTSRRWFWSRTKGRFPQVLDLNETM
jgi:hypothetical protein